MVLVLSYYAEIEDQPSEELLRHMTTLKDSGTCNDQAILPGR